MIPNIKVVAFDFDDTLVDEAFSLRERWKRTLKQFSHLSDKLTETFLSLFEKRGHTYKRHLSDTLEELNLPDTELQTIIDAFKSTKSKNEKLYDGVKETLLFLKKKGLRVGIITDGVKEYQEDRIKIAGIYELLDFIYYGDARQKPEPAFFRSCLENEIIEPQELLYVGNHFIKDIEGALAIGARACWIDENATEISQDVIAFKTMYNFYRWLHEA